MEVSSVSRGYAPLIEGLEVVTYVQPAKPTLTASMGRAVSIHKEANAVCLPANETSLKAAPATQSALTSQGLRGITASIPIMIVRGFAHGHIAVSKIIGASLMKSAMSRPNVRRTSAYRSPSMQLPSSASSTLGSPKIQDPSPIEAWFYSQMSDHRVQAAVWPPLAAEHRCGGCAWCSFWGVDPDGLNEPGKAAAAARSECRPSK
jgi:hypothetical protein